MVSELPWLKYHTWVRILSVAVFAILVGWLYRSNPLLYTDYESINVNTIQFNPSYHYINENVLLDAIFKEYETYFPTPDSNLTKFNEIHAYKNHCLRVLSMAAFYFFPKNDDGDYQHSVNLAAIGLAYHDLALWATIVKSETTTSTNKSTAGMLAYLDPSEELFLYDQRDMIVSALPQLSQYEKEIIIGIIQEHHKFTPWKRNATKGTTAENHRMEEIVNAIRCSDWADATLGMIQPMGCVVSIKIDYLHYLYHHLYELGFHDMLASLPARLSPISYYERLNILQILKW